MKTIEAIEEMQRQYCSLNDKIILELKKAEKKNAASIANNLCPDHRDKQDGKPCLACTVERQASLLKLALEVMKDFNEPRNPSTFMRKRLAFVIERMEEALK